MTTPAVRVELDVFSGRPNPSWVLDTADAADLIAKVERLTRVEADAAPGAAPRTLGYRGFTVFRDDAPWLHVGSGIVRRLDATSPALRDDAGIEAWLRAEAGLRGFGPLLPEGRL